MGHRLITAAEVHESGHRWLCKQLPSGGDVFVSIDIDGLDPSVAPASGWPQPGGLSFRHVAGVIGELSRTGRIIGGDVVELLPYRDVNGLTALTATRLLMLLADSHGAVAGNTG
jgi:agmatinase